MIETRGHYIRANAMSRVPRRWVYLDTEAHIESTPTVQLQRWRLAVTCFERRRETTETWTDPVWQTHTTPADLWAYVDSCTARSGRTIVVAHNIGYDIRISRALQELDALGWSIDRVSIGSRSVSATLKHAGKTIILTDFTTWLPMSLAEVAKLVGTSKLDLPAEAESDEVWEARCRRDVEIMRDANRDLLAWVLDGDLGNWQRTGAGMAWANWRHRHYTHKVLVHDDSEARTAEVSAIHAGRCEAWRIGHLSSDLWTEWDLPLAYPRVAQTTRLPVRLQGHVVNPTLAWLDKRRQGARVLVNATVRTKVPVLPVQGPQGYLWPTGRFSGWWWDDELALAMAWGEDVQLHHALIYQSAPVLEQWGNWIIDYVEHGGEGATRVRRAAAKHWSRALIGRFGAKFPVWVDWSEAPDPGLSMSLFYDCDTSQHGKEMTVGTRSYISTEDSYVADACPFLLGAVMAECRVRLWGLIQVAGTENVAYMDTDSLIVNDEGSKRLASFTATGAGWGLRPKTRWKTLRVLGPRQLVVNGNPRISGVPTVAKPAPDDTWTAERWDGVETTLMSPNPDVVVVRKASWQVTGTDHRRVHLARGATEPVEVDLAG